MLEVTYEVYRFRKWWKNSFKIIVPLTFRFDLKERNINLLEKEAYRRDLGPIKNLTYKEIKNDK